MAGLLANLQSRLVRMPGYGLFRVARKPVARIFASLGDDNIGLISGGVAFYAFLSIFPGIACALMVWGLFNDADRLGDYLTVMSTVVPPAAFDLIADQMVRIAEARDGGLSWGALISLMITLWSASRAVNALLQAMTVTANHDHKRGFVGQNLMALGFTLAGMIFALVSLIIIGAVPPILEALRLGSFGQATVHIFRWLMMFALFYGGVYSFYRIAHPPDETGTRVRPFRLWPGALLAATIWLLASVAFSFYLARFDIYNETFGSLGAVVALMMWLWISAFVICLGAETNVALDKEKSDADKQPA